MNAQCSPFYHSVTIDSTFYGALPSNSFHQFYSIWTEARTANVCQFVNTTKCTFFQVVINGCQRTFLCDKRRKFSHLFKRAFSLTFGEFFHQFAQSQHKSGIFIWSKQLIECVFTAVYCLSDLKSTLDVSATLLSSRPEWLERMKRARKEMRSFADFINSFSLDTNWSTTTDLTTITTTQSSIHSTNAQHLLATSLHIICHSGKNYYRNEI